MIKFIEAPDLHKDPERPDIWNIVSNAIIKATIQHDVDYVAFPGDLWKSITTNSTKGGIGEMLDFIKELIKICPVVAIEGTPSHDSPGSYRILEEAGLILLKPGRVYGYFKPDNNFSGRVRDITQSIIKDDLGNDVYHPNFENPDSILFGVPELNKNNIQAKLSLSSEEANGKALKLFENYIDSFVAPMRMKYKDIPANMLIHANLSDSLQENTTDIILKSSDIVIHTEILERANLTRVSAGHIHKPWESKIANCGYSGSPGLTWGEVGFVPAMNLIHIKNWESGKPFYKDPKKPISWEWDPDPSIDDLWVAVFREPYGTPIRKKVYSIDDIEIDPNTAYWLVSEDPKSVLPEGIHPWSRITINEKNNKSTRRATEEEISETTSIWDLALKLKPELSPELKVKFDLLQEKNKKEAVEQVNVEMLSVQVDGCKFFGKDNANIDIEALNAGLTSISGEIDGKQNGIGKSGIASFCTPYPIVVGKDTKSGRVSALKDFFNRKNAKIVKHLTRNGVPHKHVITIKAAHTKSGGKVECNLSIDGESQLDKGTFDEMLALCESLYGSHADYLLTSFYVQPLQGKTGSSLMSANMTTIRDLVQGIAGIDRDKEREFANSKISYLNESLKDTESKIEYAEENLSDKDVFISESRELSSKIATLVESINDNNLIGRDSKKQLDDLILLQKQNDINKTSLNHKKEELSNTESKLSSLLGDISVAENSIKSIHQDVQTVSKYESDKEILNSYNVKSKDFKHNKETKNSLTTQLDNLELRKQNIIIPDAEDLNKKIESYQEQVDSKVKYDQDLISYNNLKRDYDAELQRLIADGNSITGKIDHEKQLIDIKSDSCPECGYIEPDVKDQIEKHKSQIQNLNDLYEENRCNYNSLKFTAEPPELPNISPGCNESLIICRQSLSEIPSLKSRVSNIDFEINQINEKLLILPKIAEPVNPHIVLDPEFIIDGLRSKIKNSQQTEINIATWKQELKNLNDKKLNLQRDINQIVIDNDIDFKVSVSSGKIEGLRQKAQDLREEGLSLENSKKAAISKIKEIEIQEDKIKDMKSSVSGQVNDRDEWQEVASLLGSNKIPALELEIMLDSIDMEATRIIAPYQDGQYSFRTSTQNNKGTDKFDILIHDSVTGLEQSFREFSPGVKAFISDAYVKSLLLRRSGFKYNPTILDESDGPVGSKHLKEYYDVQEKYYLNEYNKKVMVISHHTESKAYIENNIDIGRIRGRV